MRRNTILVMALAIALTVATLGAASAASGNGSPGGGDGAKSLGETTLDTEVSEWEIGDGQLNGEFLTAERQGVELGLRIQERFEGLGLLVGGTNGDRVGVYQAETGDTGGNNATWNYDFHLDISEATGPYADTELADYRLVLEQDFTEQSLFGILGSDPVQLPLGNEAAGEGVCSGDTFDADALCQQSWNPGFGNDDFDPDEENTYNLRLLLTPETFDGPPLAVAIQVDVVDAE